MPRPMPREPPVTSACLAVIVIVVSFTSCQLISNAGTTIATSQPHAAARMRFGAGGGFKKESIQNQYRLNAVKPLTQRQFYEFDTFQIDTALSRLARAGELVPLPPKAFDLLVLLARNTDRLMTKAELIEALWPNTFVDEANLAQHFYQLRKALGERPKGQPFIETVPRRGYRLATSVREVVEAAPAHAAAGD